MQYRVFFFFFFFYPTWCSNVVHRLQYRSLSLVLTLYIVCSIFFFIPCSNVVHIVLGKQPADQPPPAPQPPPGPPPLSRQDQPPSRPSPRALRVTRSVRPTTAFSETCTTAPSSGSAGRRTGGATSVRPARSSTSATSSAPSNPTARCLCSARTQWLRH